MGAVHKISIALTPELAAEVDAAIATGDYASTSEVIREALRLWKTRRMGREAALDELRRLIQEGLDSGEPQPVPDDWAEQVIARGRARLAAKRDAE